MRNIDFELKFLVDRWSITEYFNATPNYRATFDDDIGYTGVNIKFPVTIPIADLQD